jgi:hypothetical protein
MCVRTVSGHQDAVRDVGIAFFFFLPQKKRNTNTGFRASRCCSRCWYCFFSFFTAKKKQYQHRFSGIKMLFAMLVLLFPPPFLFSILGHHDAVGDVDSAFSLSRHPAP